MRVALYFFAALAIILFCGAAAFAILAFRAKDGPGEKSPSDGGDREIEGDRRR